MKLLKVGKKLNDITFIQIVYLVHGDIGQYHRMFAYSSLPKSCRDPKPEHWASAGPADSSTPGASSLVVVLTGAKGCGAERCLLQGLSPDLPPLSSRHNWRPSEDRRGHRRGHSTPPRSTEFGLGRLPKNVSAEKISRPGRVQPVEDRGSCIHPFKEICCLMLPKPRPAQLFL